MTALGEHLSAEAAAAFADFEIDRDVEAFVAKLPAEDKRKLNAACRELDEQEAARIGSWVYAIQAGPAGGNIKIGLSRDPNARLRQLQTASGDDLRGLGAWPGTRQDEKAVHKLFDRLRLRGEWFVGSREVRRYVRDRGGTFRWKR